MSDFTFKEVSKNEYETFMEGKSLKIFFKIPDGNRIEDLTIRKIDDEYDDEEYENIKGEPTKAAYFEFTKIEKDNNLVRISPLAGLNFLSKEYIKIGNFLDLGKNSKINVDFKDGASPYFDDLSIENNKRLSLIFEKSDFEKIEKDELMKKTGFIPSNSSAINGNSNLTITLGDKTIIDRIIFCRSSNNLDLDNKVDLSKIKYLLCNRSCFYPKTSDFTIAVECDAFKFSQATLGTEGRSRQKNGTVCLLKNKYKEKGELNSIILESNDLILENNSSLIVDTKSLTFETSPKNRNTICEKTNKLSAKDQITLMGARLGNAQVASDNGFITIIDGDLHDATVHFSNAGDESSNGVIKNADFNQYNAFEIDGALSVENSSFKNLRFISSLDNKESVQKIENSICRDVIRLHNISKLSFSEINNTDISNDKEVEVSNEFIKDQRIGNYEDFAKNSQTRANFDRDSRITEDLEVL